MLAVEKNIAEVKQAHREALAKNFEERAAELTQEEVDFLMEMAVEAVEEGVIGRWLLLLDPLETIATVNTHPAVRTFIMENYIQWREGLFGEVIDNAVEMSTKDVVDKLDQAAIVMDSNVIMHWTAVLVLRGLQDSDHQLLKRLALHPHPYVRYSFLSRRMAVEDKEPHLIMEPVYLATRERLDDDLRDPNIALRHDAVYLLGFFAEHRMKGALARLRQIARTETNPDIHDMAEALLEEAMERPVLPAQELPLRAVRSVGRRKGH